MRPRNRDRSSRFLRPTSRLPVREKEGLSLRTRSKRNARSRKRLRESVAFVANSVEFSRNNSFTRRASRDALRADRYNIPLVFSLLFLALVYVTRRGVGGFRMKADAASRVPKAKATSPCVRCIEEGTIRTRDTNDVYSCDLGMSRPPRDASARERRWYRVRLCRAMFVFVREKYRLY